MLFVNVNGFGYGPMPPRAGAPFAPDGRLVHRHAHDARVVRILGEIDRIVHGTYVVQVIPSRR